MTETKASSEAPRPVRLPRTRTQDPVLILITIDFDALSGWLGTSANPKNNLADYSAGIFSARVGVPRLLSLFKRLQISDRVTWFLPGHSIESFPQRARAIVDSGAEIGLHGYCHEGASQLTPEQQRDVLSKCVQVVTRLTQNRHTRPVIGYRAPLYQLDESTIGLLQDHGFEYDASLSAHDARPYRLPASPIPPITAPKYDPAQSASDWMHSTDPRSLRPDPERKSLVEVPSNWYGEDMTPLSYYPNQTNSQGYVSVDAVERKWRDRLDWIVREAEEANREDETSTAPDDLAVGGFEAERDREARLGPAVYTLTLHPDCAGMAHVVGMVERFLEHLKGLESEGRVKFCCVGEAVEEFKKRGG